ncbi:Lrp/AsnC family transcriptional regulator [Caulobacter soli]|uniref:Lrp/AsnC family transcriptional regulator n=1 Tax=Caulobacter soli TaxID=2708539 RepID=UPI0013E9EFC2|nr:Lrp/AsnC family transcriptional regulator [Caulobacter soli]
MIQLDPTDRRLLAALQADASLSHAALAESIGISATSCWRRIRSLETTGVLGPTIRLVNAGAVGRGVSVMLQVRVTSQNLDQRQEFEAFLQSRAEIMECYSMSGEWDYLMRIVVADVAAYERFLMRELLKHPNVASSSSHFALSQVKYTTAIPV